MRANELNTNALGDENAQNDVGDTDPQNISLEEMEMDKVINSIVDKYTKDGGNIKDALNEYKDWCLSVSLPRYKSVVASLNSLISLVGGQDNRIMQLLNQINAGLL